MQRKNNNTTPYTAPNSRKSRPSTGVIKVNQKTTNNRSSPSSPPLIEHGSNFSNAPICNPVKKIISLDVVSETRRGSADFGEPNEDSFNHGNAAHFDLAKELSDEYKETIKQSTVINIEQKEPQEEGEASEEGSPHTPGNNGNRNLAPIEEYNENDGNDAIGPLEETITPAPAPASIINEIAALEPCITKMINENKEMINKLGNKCHFCNEYFAGTEVSLCDGEDCDINMCDNCCSTSENIIKDGNNNYCSRECFPERLIEKKKDNTTTQSRFGKKLPKKDKLLKDDTVVCSWCEKVLKKKSPQDITEIEYIKTCCNENYCKSCCEEIALGEKGGPKSFYRCITHKKLTTHKQKEQESIQYECMEVVKLPIVDLRMVCGHLFKDNDTFIKEDLNQVDAVSQLTNSSEENNEYKESDDMNMDNNSTIKSFEEQVEEDYTNIINSKEYFNEIENLELEILENDNFSNGEETDPESSSNEDEEVPAQEEIDQVVAGVLMNDMLNAEDGTESEEEEEIVVKKAAPVKKTTSVKRVGPQVEPVPEFTTEELDNIVEWEKKYLYGEGGARAGTEPREYQINTHDGSQVKIADKRWKDFKSIEAWMKKKGNCGGLFRQAEYGDFIAFGGFQRFNFRMKSPCLRNIIKKNKKTGKEELVACEFYKREMNGNPVSKDDFDQLACSAKLGSCSADMYRIKTRMIEGLKKFGPDSTLGLAAERFEESAWNQPDFPQVYMSYFNRELLNGGGSSSRKKKSLSGKKKSSGKTSKKSSVGGIVRKKSNKSKGPKTRSTREVVLLKSPENSQLSKGKKRVHEDITIEKKNKAVRPRHTETSMEFDNNERALAVIEKKKAGQESALKKAKIECIYLEDDDSVDYIESAKEKELKEKEQRINLELIEVEKMKRQYLNNARSISNSPRALVVANENKEMTEYEMTGNIGKKQMLFEDAKYLFEGMVPVSVVQGQNEIMLKMQQMFMGGVTPERRLNSSAPGGEMSVPTTPDTVNINTQVVGGERMELDGIEQ